MDQRKNQESEDQFKTSIQNAPDIDSSNERWEGRLEGLETRKGRKRCGKVKFGVQVRHTFSHTASNPRRCNINTSKLLGSTTVVLDNEVRIIFTIFYYFNISVALNKIFLPLQMSLWKGHARRTSDLSDERVTVFYEWPKKARRCFILCVFYAAPVDQI